MKIHVNQLGALPGDTMSAVVSGELNDGTLFSLKNGDGGTVRELFPETPAYDENTGEMTAVLPIGVLDDGRYYIEASDGTRSFPFSVEKGIYDGLSYDALKMFYYQRCGCELKAEHAGIYTHKACHTAKVRLLYDKSGKSFDCSGGWHDAGDYGRYVTAGAVAAAHLLYAYKLSPGRFDTALNIPESNNSVPDILNEVRYELDWFLKMQDEDGGVHHKCTSMHHTDFVMPEDDPLDFIVTPVSSLATADFAAVCALAAGIYKEFDKEFADKLRSAAVRAGNWLIEHPELNFNNPPECSTGDYSDPCDLDERLWAFAELYALTEDETYLPLIKSIINDEERSELFKKYEFKYNLFRYENGLPLSLIGWEDVGGLASLAVIFSGAFDGKTKDFFKKSWLSDAKALIKKADKNAYRLSMEPVDFVWGSNLSVLTNGIILAIAKRLTGDRSYRDYALASLDYILGRNALDISFVTGYGTSYVRNPHNRPTYADGIDEPIPGFVSGGPNYMLLDDAIRKKVPEGTAPAKCFVDDVWSYSSNEITIYWNSPLVLLLSLL